MAVPYLVIVLSCLATGLSLKKPNSTLKTAARKSDHTVPVYGYDGGPGVRTWGGVCKNGRQQSPVDFKIEENVFGKPLEFSKEFYAKPISMELENVGTTVYVKFETKNPIIMSGGPLHKDKYQFVQFHFHWGKNINEGSEHTIASRRYPLECHLVWERINTHTPHLAVIGIMYKLTRGNTSQLLELVTSNLKHIKKADSKHKIQGAFPLKDLLPDDKDAYHFYKGSLTTPPCSEIVSWIVMGNQAYVTKSQLAVFRKLQDPRGHPVLYNFRPTKPLNGRHVYLSHSG